MKVIITGSTGMVGKGVLYECLENKMVESILVINRKPLGLENPKLKEIIHNNFHDLSAIKDSLAGYDACFFCLGVSSIGMKEEDYHHITFGITSEFAKTLHELNKDMTFVYISGAGTDSTEKGRSMWARVKGKTENLVINQGFEKAYAFRPGAIIPEKGIKSKTKWIQVLLTIMKPFFPLMKKFKSVTTTVNIGKAMINMVNIAHKGNILESKDINKVAGK